MWPADLIAIEAQAEDIIDGAPGGSWETINSLIQNDHFLWPICFKRDPKIRV